MKPSTDEWQTVSQVAGEQEMGICPYCGLNFGEDKTYRWGIKVGDLTLCPLCAQDLKRFGYIFPLGLNPLSKCKVTAINEKGKKVRMTTDEAMEILEKHTKETRKEDGDDKDFEGT